MVFSSNIFLFLFLPLILAAYFILPNSFGKKYENYLLLIASLIFYAWGELVYLWLLALSIIGNYYFGILIFKFSPPQISQKNFPSAPQHNSYKKNLITFFALSFNLSLLAYFKYANFIAENISLLFDNRFSISQALLPKHLPLGISFFTFHAISYLIDIYRGKSKAQKNLSELALYIAFFPQLIAGPIVRYSMIERYLHKRSYSMASATYGIRRFLIGFAKKIIIANPLGEVVDAVFATPIEALDPSMAWIGIVCYSMQIYFDFSGYCDMAIGLARIFGFKFPENFNYPYISQSIKEFWRRWHISLSAWFRDYVYIPLGGNGVSLSRQYFNLILVFFLCALWHGANWTFIIWGLFHGIFLVFERIKIGKIFLERLPRLLRHFYVIFIVMIGWVFFRSHDLKYALGYLRLMFSRAEEKIIPSEISHLIYSHFIWMAFILSLIGFSPFVKNSVMRLTKKSPIYLVIFDLSLLLIFIFAIIRLSASTHNPFIYFQF